MAGGRKRRKMEIIYIYPVCISCWEINFLPFFMDLTIFNCKGFIPFFPFWMPSFVTAKASTFPALYQAMPDTATPDCSESIFLSFILLMWCSWCACHKLETFNTGDHQRPQSSLAYPSLVCLSGNFLRLGCKRTHLQFWSRCNLSYMLKENLLWY